jgi:hypothetical protein
MTTTRLLFLHSFLSSFVRRGLWLIVLLVGTSRAAMPQEIVELQHARSAVLGGAYNKQKEAFVGSQCVTGDPVATGSSESSLSLDQSMSDDNATNSLGFSLGARARYGVVEGSMSANFLSRSAATEFSVSSDHADNALMGRAVRGERVQEGAGVPWQILTLLGSMTVDGLGGDG